MTDAVNIRLSKEATEIAERLVATGKFENVVTVAKFALAYALKNHFNEFNPASFSIPDSAGSNYNVGSVDNDGTLATLLRAIYPDTETPYMYARSLMVFGLMKIGERLEAEGMPTISTLCQ